MKIIGPPYSGKLNVRWDGKGMTYSSDNELRGHSFTLDFVLVCRDRSHLKSLIPKIQQFLTTTLHLKLHPRKILLKEISRGVDFLGTTLFLTHKLLRTGTKKRLKGRLEKAYISFLKGEKSGNSMNQTLQSYLGILSHVNEKNLAIALKNGYGLKF